MLLTYGSVIGWTISQGNYLNTDQSGKIYSLCSISIHTHTFHFRKQFFFIISSFQQMHILWVADWPISGTPWKYSQMFSERISFLQVAMWGLNKCLSECLVMLCFIPVKSRQPPGKAAYWKSIQFTIQYIYQIDYQHENAEGRVIATPVFKVYLHIFHIAVQRGKRNLKNY